MNLKKVLLILFLFNFISIQSAQPSLSKQMHFKIAILNGDTNNVITLLNTGVNKERALFHLIYAMLPKSGKNVALSIQESCENVVLGIGELILDNQKAEEILKLLLDHGIDIDSDFALCKAVHGGCLQAVRLLIKYGANINQEDEDRKTPIMHILEGGMLLEHRIEMLDELIKAGADLNRPIMWGRTLLRHTAESLHDDNQFLFKKIIFLLLLHGADMTLKDNGRKDFFNDLNPQTLKEIKKFVQYVLESDNSQVIKGAENALLIAAYLNEPEKVNAVLRKGIWFNSNTNEAYFYNLIADKLRIRAIVEQYHPEQEALLPNYEFIKYLF